MKLMMRIETIIMGIRMRMGRRVRIGMKKMAAT